MASPQKPFDPTDFQLPQEAMGAAAKKAGTRRHGLVTGEPFIKGPIDVAWMAKARTLGVSALWVGLSLWHLKGLRHSDSFIVSNRMMKKFGVEPDAKTRALRRLENAGLIAVERRVKRNPKITIRPVQKRGSKLAKEVMRSRVE